MVKSPGKIRRRPAKVANTQLVHDAGVPAAIVHLPTWLKAHVKSLVPPVSNRQIFRTAKDVVLFVSGGPNTRNDYHVNPTEELF